MNIGIIGIGGVGGYFGGKLTKLFNINEYHEKIKIYFVSRNKHLEEIKKNGLILCSQDEGEIVCRPTLATDNFRELPVLDLCLICVKSYDLENALNSLKTKIKDETVIIPLLNGVDIYERVRSVIQNGIVCPACVYVGTHIERYGKVTQNGGSCTILFGNDPVNPGEIPRDIFSLLDLSGIKYKLCAEPYTEIWSKYIFIAAYGMVTASTGKTFGQILESEELALKVIGIMQEVKSVADKSGIKLSENIVKDSFQKGYNFPYETKTSFQRDFETANKPNEAALFGDTIIRLGTKLGIETPITEKTNKELYKKNYFFKED